MAERDAAISCTQKAGVLVQGGHSNIGGTEECYYHLVYMAGVVRICSHICSELSKEGVCR